MGEMVELLSERDGVARSGAAPPLPIEVPLVQAVRALEAVKAQADTLLLLLELAPREAGPLTAAMDTAVARLNAASLALWQLQHLQSCRGQA